MPDQSAASLERFVRAQERAYEDALHEIGQGRKQSHWMWFIFPQIQGLGHSSMSKQYAIRDLHEARAYLDHPVLGPRLVDISRALLAHRDKSAHQIFGTPDDMKLKSSMTLFAAVPGADPVFAQVLQLFFAGQCDPLTLGNL